jgi:hypothetical protein
MNNVYLFSSRKFKRNNKILFAMAEDPITHLLKFAQFATRETRDIIKLGKRKESKEGKDC